jgi:hypothetical protein
LNEGESLEVAYCDNCGSQTTAAGSFTSSGKVYCAKCAPLLKDAISPPGTSDPVKFYFCETCGKRITDKQILDGLGRDKKLKGVYCKDCAVGVTTTEFDAVQDLPLPDPAKAQSRPRLVPTHRTGDSVRGAARVTRRKPSVAIPFAVAGVVIAAAVALYIVGKKDVPSTQTEPHKTSESNKSTAPLPAAVPTPVEPKADAVSPPASKQVSEQPAPVNKGDPEALAFDAFEKVRKFENLDANDTAGRIKRLEEYLTKHGETIVSARARVMLDELKKPVQIKASVDSAPAEKSADEFAKEFNYALASNGATATGDFTPDAMIDGDFTHYDGNKGFGGAMRDQPLTVSLKSPTEINCIRFLLWDQEPTRYYLYKLDVCEDDTQKTWINIADKRDESNRCRGWQVLKFPVRKVKAIRATGANNDNGMLHIVELQAFKLDAAAPPDPQPAKP